MTQGAPLSDVEKRLKLMRFWLVGTFLIVSAGAMVGYGLFTGAVSGGLLGGALNSWPVILITAILCLAAYFGYQYWVTRK